VTTISPPLYPKTDGLSDSESAGNRDAAAERWYVGERCPAGCRVVVVEGWEVHPLLARTDVLPRTCATIRDGDLVGT